MLYIQTGVDTHSLCYVVHYNCIEAFQPLARHIPVGVAVDERRRIDPSLMLVLRVRAPLQLQLLRVIAFVCRMLFKPFSYVPRRSLRSMYCTAASLAFLSLLFHYEGWT